MSNPVSRPFETNPDWEKTLATKTQNLGDRREWIESDAALQAVISATDVPVLGGHRDEGRVEIQRDARCQSTKLSELRDELKLSADMCNRNMDIFESAFHTQQLQEAIGRSAQFVVRTSP